VYSSSKAALNHLSYHLASELWHIGIRVNAVAPDVFGAEVSVTEVLDAIVAYDESLQTGQISRIAGRQDSAALRSAAL
jgi:NAD(P)-dependent dehydrogenase (short-subunit alcohol dehydrogenase family)